MLPLCGKTPGFAIRSFFHRSMPCAEVYTAFSRTTIPASIITTNRHCDMNRCRNHHNEPSLRSAGRREIHHNEASLRSAGWRRSNPFNIWQFPRQLFSCNQKGRRPCVCTGSMCQFCLPNSSLIPHNSSLISLLPSEIIRWQFSICYRGRRWVGIHQPGVTLLWSLNPGLLILNRFAV